MNNNLLLWWIRLQLERGDPMVTGIANIWNFLKGKKTYIAAAGLFLYGVYDMTEGNVEQGWHKMMEALAVFGIRQAIAAE